MLIPKQSGMPKRCVIRKQVQLSKIQIFPNKGESTGTPAQVGHAVPNDIGTSLECQDIYMTVGI